MDAFFFICSAVDLKQLGVLNSSNYTSPSPPFTYEKTPLDKEGCSKKRYNRINPLRRALALYGIG